MTKILEKPIPPPDGACCESACSPCVWDYYYEERKAWKEQQAQLAKNAENNKPQTP